MTVTIVLSKKLGSIQGFPNQRTELELTEDTWVKTVTLETINPKEYLSLLLTLLGEEAKSRKRFVVVDKSFMNTQQTNVNFFD